MKPTRLVIGACLVTALVAVAAMPTASATHGQDWNSCEENFDEPITTTCRVAIIQFCADENIGNATGFLLCLDEHDFPPQ